VGNAGCPAKLSKSAVIQDAPPVVTRSPQAKEAPGSQVVLLLGFPSLRCFCDPGMAKGAGTAAAPALSQMVVGIDRSARAKAAIASDLLPGVRAACSSTTCTNFCAVSGEGQPLSEQETTPRAGSRATQRLVRHTERPATGVARSGAVRLTKG